MSFMYKTATNVSSYGAENFLLYPKRPCKLHVMYKKAEKAKSERYLPASIHVPQAS